MNNDVVKELVSDALQIKTLMPIKSMTTHNGRITIMTQNNKVVYRYNWRQR